MTRISYDVSHSSTPTGALWLVWSVANAKWFTQQSNLAKGSALFYLKSTERPQDSLLRVLWEVEDHHPQAEAFQIDCLTLTNPQFNALADSLRHEGFGITDVTMVFGLCDEAAARNYRQGLIHEKAPPPCGTRRLNLIAHQSCSAAVSQLSSLQQRSAKPLRRSHRVQICPGQSRCAPRLWWRRNQPRAYLPSGDHQLGSVSHPAPPTW